MTADTDVQRPDLDKTFGCDRCGSPRSAHDTDGYCPGSTYAKYREPLWWTDDGHQLAATFIFGQMRPVVVCPHEHDPDANCRQRCCPACEGEKNGCLDCGDTGAAPDGPHECILQEYLRLDDRDFLELAEQWVVDARVPLPILWHADPDLVQWRPKGATGG